MSLLDISLAESNGMGHIWSKFGDDMGEAMSHICLIYGFYMGCCPTYQTDMEPQSLSFTFVYLLSVAMGWLPISQSSIHSP